MTGWPRQRQKLFRRLGAETASGAGGDEDGGEVHPVRQPQSAGQVNGRFLVRPCPDPISARDASPTETRSRRGELSNDLGGTGPWPAAAGPRLSRKRMLVLITQATSPHERDQAARDVRHVAGALAP